MACSFISLYNPLFQCFKTPEIGPGIFTFSRACFNFFSKRFKQLKRLDLVNFLPVSVRFSFYAPPPESGGVLLYPPKF